MQRSYNLPNPEQIFRDPNYSNNAPKISQKDMEDLLNKRETFAPPPPPQQVQKFEDINNAKIFQVQSLNNDILAVRQKLAEIEKRMELIQHPPVQQQPQPLPLVQPQMTFIQPPSQQYQQPPPQQQYQQQPPPQQQYHQQPPPQQQIQPQKPVQFQPQKPVQFQPQKPIQFQPQKPIQSNQQQQQPQGFKPFNSAAPQGFR